jgi:hypothetical protein
MPALRLNAKTLGVFSDTLDWGVRFDDSTTSQNIIRKRQRHLVKTTSKGRHGMTHGFSLAPQCLRARY